MMKKVIAVLALLCLVLAGCQTVPAPGSTTNPTTVPVPTTYPPHTTGYYFTSLEVNFGGFYTTTVTVTYEKDSFTQVYTADGTTYRNTYDYQGRLLRQRLDSEDFWSEEVCTYQGTLDTPLTNTYSREGFSRTITRTFDEKGNVLTNHYSASDGSWNTTTYTYNEKGDLLTEKYISSGGSDTLLTNTYDEKGNLISEVTLNKGEKTREVKHTYDEKGNLIQDYVWRWEKSKDLITASTTDFTYDKNGNITSQHQVDLDGYWSKMECTYTESGKLLTENRSESNGYTASTVNTYDEKERLVSIVDIFDGSRYTYAYEYADLQTKITVTDPEGRVETTIRTNNRYGDLLELVITYADGSTEKDVRTYDAAGNLLTYTAYYNDTVSSACTYTYGQSTIGAKHLPLLKSLMEQTFVEFLP